VQLHAKLASVHQQENRKLILSQQNKVVKNSYCLIRRLILMSAALIKPEFSFVFQ